MATVISATSRFSQAASRPESLLSKAAVLHARARTAFDSGDSGEAIELAYQAALRTAGASLAMNKPNKRRRSSNVWSEMRLFGGECARRADEFAPVSTMRQRVLTGMDAPDPLKAAALLQQVEAFMGEVERDAGWLPLAA